MAGNCSTAMQHFRRNDHFPRLFSPVKSVTPCFQSRLAAVNFLPAAYKCDHGAPIARSFHYFQDHIGF